MKKNIKLVELSQMKAKKNNQFIDPAMFPSIAGLLGANVCPGARIGCKNCLKCWKKNFKEIIFKKH